MLHADLNGGGTRVEEVDVTEIAGLGGKALALDLLERYLDPAVVSFAGQRHRPDLEPAGCIRVLGLQPAGVLPQPLDWGLDPITLKAGEPRLLDSRTNIRIPSDVSTDGSLVAFFSIGERQEDLFVGPPGGPMRRVIDDAARDRGPFFTADGKSLLFYSNRGGDWQAWIIGLDGSGLRHWGSHQGARVSDPLTAGRPDGVLRQRRARCVSDDFAGRR